MRSTDGSKRMIWRIRAFVTAISMLALMFLFPMSVQAGKMLHANAVPLGQVIENDVFLTGQNPVVSGTVNGDVFILGSNVTISGEVNGSVFIVAENIDLPGRVSGNLYVASIELTQPEGGQIERSLYALALSLVTEPGSNIGRDLNTVAMSATMQGQTERNTAAIIGPWELFKLLQKSIDQNITGFVPSQPTLVKSAPEFVSLGVVLPYRALISPPRASDRSALVDWLFAGFKSFLKFLIIGGLIMLAFPRQFQRWVEKVKKEPWASAGYGAVVLINGYLLPVLILFLLIGLLLGLIYLSLPSVAWLFFWTGMGLLTTLFALFLAATTFLSKAIVAYLAGMFIISRIASGALQYRILPLLLGLLIYVLLASIPYVGFFIGLVATLLGLGSIWLSRRQAFQPDEAVVKAVPA